MESYKRISTICFETAENNKKSFHVYGNDYNTIDGTPVRDYVHVTDLVNAHILLMKKLFTTIKINNKNDYSKNYVYTSYDTIPPGFSYDKRLALFVLGTGQGTTVLQFINACMNATESKINVVNHPRRDGDIESIYATPKLANEYLGWNPTRLNLVESLKTSWLFRKQNIKYFNS